MIFCKATDRLCRIPTENILLGCTGEGFAGFRGAQGMLDGVVGVEDGRILVRESGTEPVVRVMVEASTDEICNQYVDEVIAVMRAQNLVQ